MKKVKDKVTEKKRGRKKKGKILALVECLESYNAYETIKNTISGNLDFIFE